MNLITIIEKNCYVGIEPQLEPFNKLKKLIKI